MLKFIILFIIHIYAIASLNISFGPVKVGEKRMKIDLKNFSLVGERKNEEISSKIYRGSTQWIRTKENILAPRALVSIDVRSEKTVSLKYQGKNTVLQGVNKKNIKVYVNIFDPEPMEIYEDDKLLDRLRLHSKIKLSKKEGHLIDYSCSAYGVEIEGLDDQYVSVGCLNETFGKMGKEYNRLSLTWSTTNYYLENGARSPFVSIIMNKSPIVMSMINDEGDKRKVVIKTKYHKRYHRLKTAFGLGPYTFKAISGEAEQETTIAPAVMLYGKWDLTKDTSFRFFDALIYNKSLFNNAGFYFAYDLAYALDGRFKIVPLLGAQVLTNKYDSNSKATHRILYPQGFEALYKHAFGIENYNIVYGMFLSTDSEETYDNAWIRWGKGYFWELNYIRWGRDGDESSMWGLSIGLPLGQYF